MDRELKRQLLQAKFFSIRYMQELEKYFALAIEGLHESIDYFYQHPPQEDWQAWHISDKPEGWEKRAVPNFNGILDSIREGIANARMGKTSTIRSVTGSMQGLSKDMDVLGWKWWKYVADDVATHFGENLTRAEQIASNIWRTVGEYWRTPDSILDEEITGPIDELELLNYMPGIKHSD